MKLIKIEKEETTMEKNFNQGGHTVDTFGTPEEIQRWRSNDKNDTFEMHGNCFSYPINVTHYSWEYQIDVSREYLEQKFSLKYVLQLIKKLSTEDRGALSKQLYKYFSKAGTSQMKKDLVKIYKDMEKVDLSDLDNRKWFTTSFVLYYNNDFMEHGGGDMDYLQFDRLTGKHLSRCLAILIDKGYLTTKNTQKNKGFKRGVYTYSNTYYTLTEKAEKYLETK